MFLSGGRKSGFNTVAIDELSTEETEFESHDPALGSSGVDVLDTPVSPGTTEDYTPGPSKKPSAASRNKKRALEEIEDQFTKESSFQELQIGGKKGGKLLDLQIEKLLWEKEVREQQQGDSEYRVEAEDSSQFFHL
ncbi:hypothetical protein C0J52_16552 [Blattella germanica]|nr:hypothetical protein C0J52_16552 [Blattella germanica]